MSIIQDFNGFSPTWCPGCGNWAIGVAIKSALVQLNFNPSQVMAVFGVGCSGNMNDFLNAYAVHSLHGRAIPTAIGMKIANHKLPVIVVAGDGDCYGEGGNHLIHACRGNHDITVIVHDNRVYGLTTGQAAPTAAKGFKSKSTPFGMIEKPLNPLMIAIGQGATFVAQTFAGDPGHMIEIIKAGIRHKGFSLINVLQPCVTFNKIYGYQYYLERIYKLQPDYKPEDKGAALKKATEADEEKFPLGIIYQAQSPSFHEQLSRLKEDRPLLQKEPFQAFDLLLKEFI